MKSLKNILLILALLSSGVMVGQDSKKEMKTTDTNNKSEEQWKGELTPEQYRVLRDCGTEPAFTGKYYNHKDDGTYTCAGCGAELFQSDTKYDSGSGWPSFYAAVDKEAIKEVSDTSLGMRRIEIKCAKCDSHLGHIFPDGPTPTGMRYCVNSISLEFEKAE